MRGAPLPLLRPRMRKCWRGRRRSEADFFVIAEQTLKGPTWLHLGVSWGLGPGHRPSVSQLVVQSSPPLPPCLDAVLAWTVYVRQGLGARVFGRGCQATALSQGVAERVRAQLGCGEAYGDGFAALPHIHAPACVGVYMCFVLLCATHTCGLVLA